MIKTIASYVLFAFAFTQGLVFANQTGEISRIHPESELPFSVKIELLDMQIPNGFQAGASAVFNGKALLIAGRANNPLKAHGFLLQEPNSKVMVLDFNKNTVTERSLYDESAKLSQVAVDSLSVRAPQFYQKGKTLYITGGFGKDSTTKSFTTKDTLTAIDIPGLIKWVENKTTRTAASCIRQISHPIFQITGGYMNQFGKHPTLLVFGETLTGTYLQPPHTQVYSGQVRRFHIYDTGNKLAVKVLSSLPDQPHQNFKRKELNVIQTLKKRGRRLVKGLVALSGVFTPEPDGGVWTVPIEIQANGKALMANPKKKRTFKQGMNAISCAQVQLFSQKTSNMYCLLLGGATFAYFQNGLPVYDTELPFTNQVTCIRVDRQGRYRQFLMKSEYPEINNRQTFFGTNAHFIPAEVNSFDNGILKLDTIKKTEVIGYIVGGIQSSLMNTSAVTDSIASPYIFKVTLEPKK